MGHAQMQPVTMCWLCPFFRRGGQLQTEVGPAFGKPVALVYDESEGEE